MISPATDTVMRLMLRNARLTLRDKLLMPRGAGKRVAPILVHIVRVFLIMRAHLAIQERVRIAVLLRPRTVTPLRLRIGV